MTAPPGQRAKLLFLVTEDWYFCSHRLPIARAARDAGFEVVVAARVQEHGEAICAEGFALRALAWRRRGDGLSGAFRAVRAITRLYRAERPDIVHHIALKPVLFGALAQHLAFAGSDAAPTSIHSIMGLGSGFSAGGIGAGLRRPALRLALRVAAAGKRTRIIVQNPADGAAVAKLGMALERIALIKGSGVDVAHFLPLSEPEGDSVTVALVSRMLADKGVLEAAAAVRRLRAQGTAVDLLLAGPTDPDNPGSLTEECLRSLASEPGIAWLGRVADVRDIWRQSAIALLPSTYGEGVPKALLEAAACARPIIATDAPGCRDVVRPGETGLLVAPHDIDGLAAAIRTLAADRARRRSMGQAGRALVEREFGEVIVARETLALYRRALQERDRELR